MDKRLLVAMLGSAALAILAVVGKSAVMFVSAAAIAAAVYVFRNARVRDRIIGIIAAGLAGSIGAEIVHTVYHYTNVAQTGAGGNGGGFFMSAILVGAINIAAIIVLMIVIELWFKFFTVKSR
jgi:hypothetical protein